MKFKDIKKYSIEIEPTYESFDYAVGWMAGGGKCIFKKFSSTAVYYMEKQEDGTRKLFVRNGDFIMESDFYAEMVFYREWLCL